MPTQRSFAFPLLARLLAPGLLLLWLGWWGMPSYAQPAGEPLQDIITLEAGNFDTCALTVQGGCQMLGSWFLYPKRCQRLE